MLRNLLSVLVALITVLAIHVGNFPGSVPRVRAESGGELFDTKPAKSSHEVLERIGAYGDRGRTEYQFRNMTTDIVLPLSVQPMLFICTRRWRKSLGNRKLQLTLAAAPLVYLLFDLVENLVVYLLITQYPNSNETFATILPWLTIIKRIGAFTSLATLFASTVAWFRGRL